MRCLSLSNDFNWLSRMQSGDVPDCLQALIQRQILKDFEPLLSVPHVSDVEFPISNVLEPDKFRFKVLRDRIRTRAVVLRAEVKVATIPFTVDVHDVIPLRIFGGWFDEICLQEAFYELISFLLNFGLEIIRHLGLSGGVYPLLLGWHGGLFHLGFAAVVTFSFKTPEHLKVITVRGGKSIDSPVWGFRPVLAAIQPPICSNTVATTRAENRPLRLQRRAHGKPPRVPHTRESANYIPLPRNRESTFHGQDNPAVSNASMLEQSGQQVTSVDQWRGGVRFPQSQLSLEAPGHSERHREGRLNLGETSGRENLSEALPTVIRAVLPAVAAHEGQSQAVCQSRNDGRYMPAVDTPGRVLRLRNEDGSAMVEVVFIVSICHYLKARFLTSVFVRRPSRPATWSDEARRLDGDSREQNSTQEDDRLWLNSSVK